jgi:hypothetical protein
MRKSRLRGMTLKFLVNDCKPKATRAATPFELLRERYRGQRQERSRLHSRRLSRSSAGQSSSAGASMPDRDIPVF